MTDKNTKKLNETELDKVVGGASTARKSIQKPSSTASSNPDGFIGLEQDGVKDDTSKQAPGTGLPIGF